MKYKEFFYDKYTFNSHFDIVDVNLEIIPDYFNRWFYPDTFTITKLTFLLFGRNKIKRLYINGNHPNVNMETRLIISDKIKNKKIDSDLIEKVSKVLKRYQNGTFFDLNNKIPVCNFYGREFRFYDKKKFNMNYNVYEINKRIIPERVYTDYNSCFSIKTIPENFIIERVRFFTDDDRIISLNTDAPHPNSDIVDRSFCLPQNLIGQKIKNIPFIVFEELLKIYNLINPHFHPDNFLNNFIELEKS